MTLGDAAGVGPEVALKALQHFTRKSRAEIILAGPEIFYRRLAARLRLGRALSGVRFTGNVEVPGHIRYGRVQNALSHAAMRSIETAAHLALTGGADAVVTAPINKAGIARAGYRVPGHTEFLAQLCKTRRFEMMLVGGGLRVVPLTRHVALKEVPRLLTRTLIVEGTRLVERELTRSFGIDRPRIVICGLNPHAGEKGTFGSEEARIIRPAAEALRRVSRSEIAGPLSPDALFADAYRGRYDAVICMYHDQGLIPLKMVSRGHGVNVTLGLPFVRTSPDHGTAYDIAGRFAADAGSMLEALALAEALVRNRRRHAGTGRRG